MGEISRRKRSGRVGDRYRWDMLTLAEKEAVKDAMQIGLLRAGLGAGLVLTGTAAIGARESSFLEISLSD